MQESLCPVQLNSCKTTCYSALSGNLLPAIVAKKRRTQLRAPASPACSTVTPDDGDALQRSACIAVYELMNLVQDTAVSNLSGLTAAIIMLLQC